MIALERTEIHSKKPSKFREIIDEMYVPPNGRNDRIELFAGGKVPAWWDVWGYEANGSTAIAKTAEFFDERGP